MIYYIVNMQLLEDSEYNQSIIPIFGKLGGPIDMILHHKRKKNKEKKICSQRYVM